MPPEVGYADTSSDMVKPMIRMKTERIGQAHEIEIGPPLFQPAPKLVKQPARIEMIENEIAKFEKPDQRAVEVLLVAELGEVLLVVGELGRCRPWRCLLRAWWLRLSDGTAVVRQRQTARFGRRRSDVIGG